MVTAPALRGASCGNGTRRTARVTEAPPATLTPAGSCSPEGQGALSVGVRCAAPRVGPPRWGPAAPWSPCPVSGRPPAWRASLPVGVAMRPRTSHQRPLPPPSPRASAGTQGRRAALAGRTGARGNSGCAHEGRRRCSKEPGVGGGVGGAGHPRASGSRCRNGAGTRLRPRGSTRALPADPAAVGGKGTSRLGLSQHPQETPSLPRRPPGGRARIPGATPPPAGQRTRLQP